MQLLMETVSAADQENRRKPLRAGSVPPRATTPVNPSNSYVPGVKTGVVTPAVRPASHISSQSVPNKRQRLGENLSSAHTPNYAVGVRAPLGASRSNNGVSGTYRGTSPTKIPSKTPNTTGGSPAISMIMPKPGTQHHALGHGRIPSSVVYGVASGSGNYPVGVRSSSSSQGYGRFPSSGYAKKGDESGMMKKATRASRESFKPRPSMDAMDIGVSVGVGGGSRWGGGFTLKEEDEGL